MNLICNVTDSDTSIDTLWWTWFVGMLLPCHCGTNSEWSTHPQLKPSVTRSIGSCTRSFRMSDWWRGTSPSTPPPAVSSWQPRSGHHGNGSPVSVIVKFVAFMWRAVGTSKILQWWYQKMQPYLIHVCYLWNINCLKYLVLHTFDSVYDVILTDFAKHAVPRIRDHERGGLGHIWRDPLHERQR